MYFDASHPSSVTSNVSLMPETGTTATAGSTWPDSPTLRFKELLKLLRVSRSKAYELMKTDPAFPCMTASSRPSSIGRTKQLHGSKVAP